MFVFRTHMVIMVLTMLSLSFRGYAQVADSTYYRLENTIERLTDNLHDEETGAEVEEYLQFLIDMMADPVNLNRASLDELLLVPDMSPVLARRIIAYRDKKTIETVDELLIIEGIGPVTLDKLRPFVAVGSGYRFRRDLYLDPSYWTQNQRFEAITRYQQVLESQAGYQSINDTTGARYIGSPVRYYQRFNYRSAHLSANLTQLKAPGETLSGPLGFDYNSGHVALQNNGRLRMLVVGDYGLHFGQGLVFKTGMGFRKGSEVIRIRENEKGVRPYQSTGRTQAKRGVAVTYGGSLQGTVFYSSRNLSATEVEGDTVRFPASSGFHRTQNELDRRFNTNLETYGGRLRYVFSHGSVGVSGYRAGFDNYILPREAVYNRYDFEGQIGGVVGLDYLFTIRNAVFFGEAAQSHNGGKGVITGLTYPVGATEMSLAYRNYTRDFQSLFGNGFGESSKPQNEEGFYLAVRHAINRETRVSGYFDQYRFKTPRFGTRHPTKGYDWLLMAEHRISREIQVTLQARDKKREDDYLTINSMGREAYLIDHNRRGSIRVQLDYQINPELRSRTRVERVRGKNAGEVIESGMLVFQDFRWQITNRLMMDARMTMFDTESFTSRVFQFENDLLYVMSNTALYDRGQRSYLVIRYQAGRVMEFWLKYGVTIYESRLTVGSGLDESIGNSRSNLGIQMRMRL